MIKYVCMKLYLENFINKEKLKSCLILGSGTTMTEFPFKKFKGKIIVIGDAGIRGRNLFTPDYWVVSNNHFPVPYVKQHREVINSFKKTTFLFCESSLHDLLWKKKTKIIKNKLKVNWAFYDERHFEFQKCEPELQCCKYIRKDREISTIQEMVSHKFNYKKKATIGATVFEYALAFSLLLGFSKIYIQGVDLPFEKRSSKHIDTKDTYKFSDLGYEYATNFDNKTYKYLKKINSNTKKIVTKKSNKIFKEKNNFLNYLVYIFVKKIKKFFFNKNLPAFSKDKEVILKNIKLYSNIAKKNNVKIFNLSKKSNLNLIKNISYISKL